MTKWKTLATAALAALVLGAAPAPSAPKADTPETKYPIFGTWTITKYTPAPWIEAGEDTADIKADAEHHLHLQVTFKPGVVLSKDTTLGCKEADYQPTDLPPEGLFQGGLPAPDQAKLAASYGLPADHIDGFDLDCSTGLFSYHFANADTLLFALSDVIYWLERKK